MTATQTVIDAIGRDSAISASTNNVGAALRHLYGDVVGLLSEIDALLADESWSQDREPYEWLREVRASVAMEPRKSGSRVTA